MDRFIAKLLAEFEGGKISRRQLIQSIAVAATVYGAGAEVATAAPTLGLRTISVNHISYGCPDYTKARDFYVKLLGMDYPADMDTGGQACLPFGPKIAATFMLPRGGRDTNAPPAPERGARGGGGAGAGAAAAPAGAAAGGAAPAAGARAGGGGGGGGRAGNPADPCADKIAAERAAAAAANPAPAGGGRGNRPPVTATIDQLGFLVANWDAKRVEAALKKFGLDPKPEGSDAFHVTDPYGLDVMIVGPKMGAY